VQGSGGLAKLSGVEKTDGIWSVRHPKKGMRKGTGNVLARKRGEVGEKEAKVGKPNRASRPKIASFSTWRQH